MIRDCINITTRQGTVYASLHALGKDTEREGEREIRIVGEREESKNPRPLDLWDHRCTSAIVTRPTAKTDTLVHPGGKKGVIRKRQEE